MGVVGHRHRLGESLGLVVDPTRPHRVHVAPVVLGLGMDLGIAVDLAGGRQEEAGRLGPGQAEAVVGPEAADLEGLDRHLEVVLGRRRRGEVHDGVDRARHPDVGGDVELDVGEAGGAEEVLDVVHVAGDEVVDGDDLVAAPEQTLAQVRPEEAGTAGDHHACHCQYTPFSHPASGATASSRNGSGGAGDPEHSHQVQPTPRNVKPRRRRADRSSRLRASTTAGVAMRAFTWSRSSHLNSSHSVSTRSTSAPSQAS